MVVSKHRLVIQVDSAYDYLTSQLRMETNRNFTEISRETGKSSQNMQHFMSNSPWQVQPVYQQVIDAIKQISSLQTGGVLILDDRYDEKAGDKSAGAGRQYNGRFGKVDMSFVQSILSDR